MRAEELMINDWIVIAEPDRYAGATGQIKSLSYHQESDAAYFYVFIQGKFGYLLKEVCSDDIRPIPLTPEILEKNGFRVVFEGELHVCYFQDIGRFHVEIKVDKVGIFQKLSMCDGFGNQVTIIECRFVHQLQHAFILCGINNKIITV